MAKLILMDQLHIDFLVPSKRSPRQVDAVVRLIRQPKFLNDILKAVRTTVRRTTSMRKVVVRVSR